MVVQAVLVPGSWQLPSEVDLASGTPVELSRGTCMIAIMTIQSSPTDGAKLWG